MKTKLILKGGPFSCDCCAYLGAGYKCKRPEEKPSCIQTKNKSVNWGIYVEDKGEDSGICNGIMCKGDQENGCRALGERGFFCTLDKGHVGDHIACGYDTHNIDSWAQEVDNVSSSED